MGVSNFSAYGYNRFGPLPISPSSSPATIPYSHYISRVVTLSRITHPLTDRQSLTTAAQDEGEDRRRKLQFKKKKQRSQEPRVNLKNIKSLDDLDEYDDYQF